MIFYQIILISISLLYLIIIVLIISGWNKIPNFQGDEQSPSELFISIVVALRNEEKNLPHLINSIFNQSLDQNFYELILINDHSTDKTPELAKELIAGKTNCKYIDLIEHRGKKYALSMGVKHAKGNLIVTTDADCIHHPNWLKSIKGFYSQYKPKMVIGPVVMSAGNVFENLQAIDFLSLIASGAGACGIKRSMMCNGANLAFEKTIFFETENALNCGTTSGDDTFLLHQIKKQSKKIYFLKSNDAVVTTKAEKSFKQLMGQRKRWASKGRFYTDRDTIITAFAVFLVNLSLLVNLVLSIIFPGLFRIFIVQFTIKCIPDFILLYQASAFFKQIKLLHYFILAEILNLFFIPYVAVSGNISGFNWKGRSFNR